MPNPALTREQYVLMKEGQKRGLLNEQQTTFLTESENRNLIPSVSKQEFLGHVLAIKDPDSRNDSENQAYATEWASRIDLANTKIRTEGRRVPMSPEAYFGPHKTGADRIKYIQEKFRPGSHPEITNKWQKYRALDPEKKLEEAKRIGREIRLGGFPGLLPAREFLGAGQTEDTLRGLAAFSRGTPILTFEKAGLARSQKQREADLTKRVDGELFNKAFLSLRSSYEGILSKESQHWAEESARTGVWTDFAHSILPPEEQQHAVRYAKLLRAYDPDGPLKELGKTALNVTLDIGVGSVEFLAERGEDAMMHGTFLVADIFGDKDVTDNIGLQILARDQERARSGLELEFEAPKFEERGEGLKGLAFKGIKTVVESLPYMLMATPAGPAAALRGSVLVTSMAKSHSDIMIKNGVAPERAVPLGVFSATANLYIERIIDIPALGKVGKAVIVKSIYKSFTERAVKGAMKVSARGTVLVGGETLEEVMQGLNELLKR